jgi:lysozyme
LALFRRSIRIELSIRGNENHADKILALRPRSALAAPLKWVNQDERMRKIKKVAGKNEFTEVIKRVRTSILRFPRPCAPAISVGLAALLLNPQFARGSIVCPGPTTLPGIDVSEFQGTIDWNAVAASGVQFAFTRVSDGLTPDSAFSVNYSAIKAAGMVRGAYQFFEPGQDPASQAALLLQSIGPLGIGDLPPVLDVEITGGQSPAQLAADIQTWVNAVQQAIGRTPMIYTGTPFWNSAVALNNSFSAEPLWIAGIGVGCPNLPSIWHNWVFWQFSDTGSVPGVSTLTDLDEFNGSLMDLNNLAANYDICPLYDQAKAVHSGATIPVRIELCTADGTDVSSSSIIVTVIGFTMVSSDASGTLEDPSAAPADADFRFDSTLGTNGGYIINLSTKGLSTGTYQLLFTAGADPRVHSVGFQVR